MCLGFFHKYSWWRKTHSRIFINAYADFPMLALASRTFETCGLAEWLVWWNNALSFLKLSSWIIQWNIVSTNNHTIVVSNRKHTTVSTHANMISWVYTYTVAAELIIHSLSVHSLQDSTFNRHLVEHFRTSNYALHAWTKYIQVKQKEPG